MQGVDLILNTVFIIAFLTLYGTVSWGLFRYSTKPGYRFWAFGWVIYSIGGIQSAFSPQNLILLDILGLTCFYVGSTLILDGSRETKLTQRRLILYLAGVSVIFLATLSGIALSLPYYMIFGILGLHIAYVCLLSARTVYSFKDSKGMPRVWLIVGLLTWAISWLVYPFVIILPSWYYDFVVTLQAAGVIVTGASMLIFFTMTVTHNLEQQYQISQIMSSLIQHDIRNYIHVSRSTLELIQGSSPAEKQYIGIASETLDDASIFINEMCDLTSLLARVNVNHELTSLSSIVAQAAKRVQQAYSLEPHQIDINISESTMIKICPLIKEILWNIFDNAFKHGSKVLYVQERIGTRSEVVLEISDRSGGLPTDIKDFLNSPDSLSSPVAPGFGLGIVLIHGLSIICNANYHVEDVVEDSEVLGTKYTIKFATA
ncbi:MAG: HAMP domain-containing histidine kinase [Candidatus Thorarchaeota archaeon]|nr:HAMP domain-containing histidine kinase [Candidatus Thorarchaeota archaeon]